MDIPGVDQSSDAGVEGPFCFVLLREDALENATCGVRRLPCLSYWVTIKRGDGAALLGFRTLCTEEHVRFVELVDEADRQQLQSAAKRQVLVDQIIDVGELDEDFIAGPGRLPGRR